MEVNDTEESPVFAMSLVENPATEVEWVALSKQNKIVRLAVSDVHKRELVGVALVPSMAIPRIGEDGEEYDIFFSPEVVQKAAYGFVANGLTKSITLEHSKKSDGAVVVESWIVEDAVMDKLQKYGVNAPIGSWGIKMRVTDDQIWEDVKLGKYKGFSLEGAFKHVERNPDNVEMSKPNYNDDSAKLAKIKELLMNVYGEF